MGAPTNRVRQTQLNYQRDNCLDIAKALEVLDDIFFKSKYRKDNYKVKQFRYRTIITTFGEIRFKRRQYQNKNYEKDIITLLTKY